MSLLELPCTAADLVGFRRSQRLAYDCAVAVEGQLQEGMTEQVVADLMRHYLSDRGVHHYFHAPFVWFGDRTELAVDWGDDEFLPSQRRLTPGMPVILDVAPIVEGYASDIGYAFSFGPNPAEAVMLDALQSYRDLIPRMLNGGATLQQVYQEIDARIAAEGYRSSHHAYPAGVIGHRVTKLVAGTGDEALAGGFGKAAYNYLKKKKDLSGQDPLVSPYWNGCDQSAHAPEAGLWAVEPHFARGGIGVKFEELLVVSPEGAYWLDNDLPHVRRWQTGAQKGRLPADRAEPSTVPSVVLI